MWHARRSTPKSSIDRIVQLRGRWGRRTSTCKEDPVTTRGVVFIHAAPPALCPHIEWALASVLGARVSHEWTAQPAEPSLRRAELSWVGKPGVGGQIASALRGWQQLRFEVTEEPSPQAEGTRYACTPQLGL